MKTIGVATDSHSAINPETASKLGVYVLPMPFIIDGVCYYENTTLTREAFFQKLESGAQISTSQAVPGDVTALWDKALEEYDQILYIPISSGLSGSCSTAKLLASDEPYAGRVFVCDCGRVSTPMHQSVLDALELIKEGKTAEEIQKILDRSTDEFVVYIAVETLEYLKRGGRISSAAAAIGGILGIKPILKLATGKLESYRKARGMAKAREMLIEAVITHLETDFADADARGEVKLLISTSAAPDMVAEWKHEVENAFPGREVMNDDLPLGLCCHIGPGGLGIGLAAKPHHTAD